MAPAKTRLVSDFDCIFLACSEREQKLVAEIVEPAGIRVHYAATLEEADHLMAVRNATVLLAEAGSGCDKWEAAMEMLNKHHPAAALVLVSGDADEGFWIDALEKGAYDLVLKPFVGSELRRILENANAHAQAGVADGYRPPVCARA